MHLVAAPSRIATVFMNSGNTREALNKHVDNEDKTTVAICNTGFNFKSRAIFINENGNYGLILS